MDRLIAFYRDVFDGDVVLDMREEDLRHVFIDLGGGFVLHPFEIDGVDVPQGELTVESKSLRAASSCRSAYPIR
jgi:hypothetical protein